MTAWTDTSVGVVVRDVVPDGAIKVIMVRAPAAFINNTDTMAVDLTHFGALQCLGVIGFQETTAGSITQQMSISVTTGGVVGMTTACTAAGILTITPKSPASTCITTFIIFAQ